MYKYTKAAIAVALFFTIVLISAVVIMYIEELDFINSFHMSMMTATTVGYGLEPHTKSGKTFLSLYSILSIGSFFYMFSVFVKVFSVFH